MSKANFIIKDNLTDESASYHYYIELIEREEDDVILRGWVYSLNNESVEVELLDNDRNVVKDSRVWRKSRRDVKKKFDLDNDYKAEFIIRFQRSTVNDKTIYIRFSAHDRKGDNPFYIDIDMEGLDYSFTTGGKISEFLTNQPVRRTLRYVRDNGPRALYGRVRAKIHGDKDPYIVWRESNAYTAEDYAKQKEVKFDYNPLISISIPLYNTPMEFFEPLMDSIMGQTYSNFELCLADGSDNDSISRYIKEHYKDEQRINYIHLDKNLGIAGNTNKALDMATGEYVMLTDHDDLLDKGALYEIVKALNMDKDIDIIYTDEDLVDASGTIFSNYRFKPDFNLEMLRHLNYICHIFCVRKSIIDKVGGFREEYDGAQDYDLILRCCETSDKIHHIPKILYHWRAHEDSTAGNADSKTYAIDATVRGLKEHYKRVGIDADVEATDIFIMLKTTRKLQGSPKVSILIPTKDHIDDLDKCIKSIIDKTTYSNYEIIVIENNSTDENTFAYYDKIQAEHDNIKVCTWKPNSSETFNYSKINNFGAKNASGDYYILLNNDIEVITPDWIERMLGYCMDKSVGAVGAKLLYPDDTIQHCGVVIGVGGFAGHILTEQDREDVGYFGRLRVQQEISAVTAACMMVDAKVFNEIDGFDEEFAVALNDVDLCLKIRDKDYKIILDPNIMMYHYESKSRGYEESREQHERFKREIKRFRDKWDEVLEAGDPYYSPNLTHMYGDCSPRGEAENFDIIDEIEEH